MSDSAAATAEAQFRAQAAALAQALRQADETASVAPTSPHDTYRQLCFDDPVVSAAACQALAKALLASNNNNKKNERLALSNRLVAGVAQLLQQTTSQNDEAVTADTTMTSLLNPPPAVPSTSSSAGGYTLLAWTVYGHLPLMILLSDHLAAASAWMGSFRAPPKQVLSQDDDSVPLDNANVQEHAEALRKREQAEEAETSAVPKKDKNDDDNNNNTDEMDHDSLQEVWAAESDPSDYDYGTEPSPNQRLAELEAWTDDAFCVDPTELSQPLSDTTWLHVAETVTFLLQQLKYSTALVGITMSTWKQCQISAKLTQCTLALLLPFTLQSTPLLSQCPENHWQQLALQPLHAFRDAVEEHPAALLDDYLNLLVLLLQAHHASSSSGAATTRPTKIAPATLVGLGALATLCNATLDKKDVARTELVRETMLRVADDLTTVLEMVDDDDPVVPWTFLSLWHVLSTWQHGPGLTNAQAQVLLQSGLVRQWMMTWQEQKKRQSDNTKKSLLQTEMERSILHLVCAAPTTIGKYAWRFSQFAGHVTTVSTTSGNHSWEHVVLWNLVGSRLADIAGSGGLVSLKKTGTTAARPAPTESKCRQQAVESFQTLCQGISQTLSSWKDRRMQQESGGSSEHEPPIEDDTKQLLECFHAIVNALSIPLVRELFLEKFVTTAGFDAADVLAPIRKLIVSWPSPKSHEDTKENNAAEESPESETITDKGEKLTSDDDDGEVARPKRRRGRTEEEDEAVASLRKSIKVLQSTLDLAGQSGSGRFSSKAD